MPEFIISTARPSFRFALFCLLIDFAAAAPSTAAVNTAPSVMIHGSDLNLAHMLFQDVFFFPISHRATDEHCRSGFHTGWHARIYFRREHREQSECERSERTRNRSGLNGRRWFVHFESSVKKLSRIRRVAVGLWDRYRKPGRRVRCRLWYRKIYGVAAPRFRAVISNCRSKTIVSAGR